MSLSDLLEEYPSAHNLKLICMIFDYSVSSGLLKTGGGILRDNVHLLPAQQDTSSLRINAVAYNIFENFPFSIYVTSLDEEPWTEASLKALIRNKNVVIVESDCYAHQEGEITLYGPTGKIFDQTFDD